MLSQIPINLEKVDPKDLDKEILRAAMIAELDAVNLYEQMASVTKNETLKEVLLSAPASTGSWWRNHRVADFGDAPQISQAGGRMAACRIAALALPPAV